MNSVTIMALILGLVISIAGFAAYQWYAWRKSALSAQAFIENPNVKLVDKEQEYQSSYEAMLNALDEERRQQLVAMNEAFDYINDNGPFPDSCNTGLMQVRNVLLRAIQINTHGKN